MAVCDGKWPSRTEIVFWFEFCTLRLRWIFIFIFISIFSICPFFHSLIVTTCESLRKILFSCVRFVCVLVFVYQIEFIRRWSYRMSIAQIISILWSSLNVVLCLSMALMCCNFLESMIFTIRFLCAKNCHLFAIDSTISKRQENTIFIIRSFFCRKDEFIDVHWDCDRYERKKPKMNQTNCEE